MAKLELRKSGVLFNEELHEYWLDGKQLSGITGLIQRQLFPEEYEGIPQRIIQNAAAYGTDVHKRIENFDKNWINDGSQEVLDYISICKENGLVHEASEYLVSDEANYASAIDKVYRRGDAEFSIGDIKSYYGKLSGSKLDKCRWQLSLYAYFMELQNPQAKVKDLFVIHLRNKEKKDGTIDHVSEIIFVDRIPSDICKELLDCDLRGEQFKNPFAVPEDIEPQIDRMRVLIEMKNAAEEELASIKANILSSMEFLDVKTWVTNAARLTRKLPTTRTSFDLKSFKVGHPEIQDYDLYMKTSKIAGSLMVAV